MVPHYINFVLIQLLDLQRYVFLSTNISAYLLTCVHQSRPIHVPNDQRQSNRFHLPKVLNKII